MIPQPPTEEQLLAVHAALIEGCHLEIACACDRSAPECVALIALPHGTPEAQVSVGSRTEITREIFHFAAEEGPALSGLFNAATSLARRPPVARERLLCVVIALGQVRFHDIPWPHGKPPFREA